MKSVIQCAECGADIGFYETYDDGDTGDAEWEENYGGEIDGGDFCIDCYEQLEEE
jgi:hypothetical protein